MIIDHGEPIETRTRLWKIQRKQSGVEARNFGWDSGIILSRLQSVTLAAWRSGHNTNINVERSTSAFARGNISRPVSLPRLDYNYYYLCKLRSVKRISPHPVARTDRFLVGKRHRVWSRGKSSSPSARVTRVTSLHVRRDSRKLMLDENKTIPDTSHLYIITGSLPSQFSLLSRDTYRRNNNEASRPMKRKMKSWIPCLSEHVFCRI